MDELTEMTGKFKGIYSLQRKPSTLTAVFYSSCIFWPV